MNAERRRTAIVALVAIGIALTAYATDVLRRPELDSIDARFSVRGTETPPNDLVVVKVDDVTFGELQKRWPLPRHYHGQMVRRLSADGARAIVYDVQFTEPTSAREDNALIDAVADSKAPVVLATEEVDEHGRTSVFGGDAVLKQIDARAGNSAFEPDPGGVFRRLPYSTGGLESLAVVGHEAASGEQVDPDEFPDDGAWIDFYGPPETIPSYSFSRVLRGKVDPDAFRDKVVVVGVSAPRVQDVHPVATSGDELMSGPEIEANAIATVQRGLPLEQVPWPLGVLIIALLGLVVPAAGLRFRAPAAVGIGLIAGAVYLVLAQLLFNGGVIVPVVDPILGLVLAIIGTLAVHYLVEAFERQRTHDTFARFVPEGVVGEVMKRTDDDLRLGAVRRESTVLFSDLRGFTSFAEELDPDTVVEILNRYLGEMTDAIMDHGGTLVSYMGDGIMAVFGAPLDQPDHAARALAAAREMLEVRLLAFNEWMSESGYGKGFDMGVGVNSGFVMSGQVGSKQRVEYTTIGDTTNTASRLEGMTKGTPHSLFVSGSTKDLLDDDGGLEFVEEMEVRGRAKKISVWTLPEGQT